MTIASISQTDAHVVHGSGTKNSPSKRNSRPAYVITISGDTIRGSIEVKKSTDLADKHIVKFVTQTGSKIKYDADSLRQYTIMGDSGKADIIYVSIKLNDMERENTFARLYIDGPGKIYGLFEINASPYGSRVVEYHYIKIGDGPLTGPLLIGFKKDMKKLFAMCPAIVAKIESEQYTYSNWWQMVLDYNSGTCK